MNTTVKTSTVKMLESEVEKYLVNQVKKAGGWAIKFQSEGNAGVPDRIVFWPDGKIHFIEVKRPGGKLRPLQINQCKKISGFNNYVYVVDSKDAANEYIQKRLTPRFMDGRDWEADDK